MNNSIFSTSNYSINAALVTAIGPVREIPEEFRKGEATHSFKIITVMGTFGSYHKSEESAKKAKTAITIMVGTLRSNLFTSAQHAISSDCIVAFSHVLPLNSDPDYTHAIKIQILTNSVKDSVLWLKYQSEDHAKKARKAVYAAVQAVNRIVPSMEEVVDGIVDEENN